MKHLILTLALVCSACAPAKQYVIRNQVQYVDKPVFICPKPPEVPQYTFLVDQLTPADQTDPGKVGQAYVHDMIILRETDRILRSILQQYTTTSVNFEQVRQQVDKLIEKTSKPLEKQ